ncbi:uncharacterized protein LOC124942123 [Impatiens glandulifera]|uniref:uncharacterized protein LOC124942123 n=1 Tax=Impatiens glandulifera TaxID=253017 RepID=UPI001FB08A0A|nr:uncharacterized protein LOC124942123 [Impatiens glandulifera]
MSEEGKPSSKDSDGGSSWGYHLNSSLVLSLMKLDGSNYLAWSQACLLSIQANRKHKFINGTSKKPKDDDPRLDDWESDNARVKTWLFNSMEPNIKKSYLFLASSQEI